MEPAPYTCTRAFGERVRERARSTSRTLIATTAVMAILAVSAFQPSPAGAETWSNHAATFSTANTLGVTDEQAPFPVVVASNGIARATLHHNGTTWTNAQNTSQANIAGVIGHPTGSNVLVWTMMGQWDLITADGTTTFELPPLAGETSNPELASLSGDLWTPVVARASGTSVTVMGWSGGAFGGMGAALSPGTGPIVSVDVHARTNGSGVVLAGTVVAFEQDGNAHAYRWDGSSWTSLGVASDAPVGGSVEIVSSHQGIFVLWLEDTTGDAPRVSRHVTGTTWDQVLDVDDTYIGDHLYPQMRLVGERPVVMSRMLRAGTTPLGPGVNEVSVWEWWGSHMVRVAGDPATTAPTAASGVLTEHAGRPAIAYKSGTDVRLLLPNRDGSAVLTNAWVGVSMVESSNWIYEYGGAACGGITNELVITTELVADDVDAATFDAAFCDLGTDPMPASYHSSPADPTGDESRFSFPGIRNDVQEAQDVRLRVMAQGDSMDAVRLEMELRRQDGTLLSSSTVPVVSTVPTIYETPPIVATWEDLRGAQAVLRAYDDGMSFPSTRMDIAAVNLQYDAETDWTARLRPNAIVGGNGDTQEATGGSPCVSVGSASATSTAFDVETMTDTGCVDFTNSTSGIDSDDVTLGFDTVALGGSTVTDVGLGVAASWEPSFAGSQFFASTGATTVAGCADPFAAAFFRLYCGNAAPLALNQSAVDALTFQMYKENAPTAEIFHLRAVQLDVLVGGAAAVLGPPGAARDGTGADVDGQLSTSTLQVNWDTVTHDDFDEYEYCFTSSSTGADCATTAHRTWLATSATSASIGSLSLAGGSTHYACVRSVHTDTTTTSATCSDGTTIDPTPPGTPTLVSPANLANVAVAPALTATYVDGQSSGRVEFQVCPTSACTSITATGFSAVVANGVNGTWTSSAVGGTWFWRARNVDAAGSTSAWTATWSYTFNAVPTVTPLTPLAAAWVTSAQPVLSARHDDADGSNGTVTIETCLTNAASPWSTNCGPTYQSMSTTAGTVASGTIAALQPNVALAQGTSYWRARTVDTGGSASAWSGGRSLQVDSLAPAPAPVVTFVRKGRGRVDISWVASTDTGYGSVDYDVEVWNDTVGAWQALCTTTSLTCTKTGVGGDELLVARVRACDGLNNCTGWNGGGVGANSGYIMRNVASANLGNGQSRAATLTGVALDIGTSIAWTSGSATSRQGDFPFRYNTALSTKQTLVAGVPQASPNGWGWVIDDVENKWLPAGGMEMSIVTEQTAGVAGNVGILCRVWRLQTNGSNAMTGAWTHIGDDVGSIANVLPGISGPQTSTCDFPNAFPTQTSFANDEVLYVEVVAQSTLASNNDVLRLHLNTSTASTINIPQPGLRPDLPLYVSPADTAWVPLAPTLTTTYQHPTPRNGSVQVQVATDLGFGSIVGTYNTTQLAHGEDGSVSPTGLTPGVTYYWRARGIDSGSLVGSWTVPRTFRTNQPPAAPNPTSPANGATIGAGPLPLVAGAFSDPDSVSGDSHAGSQWQVIVNGGAWSDPVAESGTVTGTSWTGPSLVTNTYRWRVRYQDSLGTWSPWSIERTVTVNGGSTSIGVDDPSVDLGLLFEGDDGFGSTGITIASTSITGYTLTATDASDTLAMNCVCGDTLADWTGTGATPSTWTAGAPGYGGITVRDAPGGRLPKWGDGTATSETDTSANRYAGLDSSVSTVLHSFGASTTSDRITATWRANFGPAESIGSYSNTTVLTVAANP